MKHLNYFLFALLFVSPLTLCMQPDQAAATEAEDAPQFRWEKIDDVPREERDQPGWWLFSREGWEEHIQEKRVWKKLARERAAREEAEHAEEIRLMGEFARLQRVNNRIDALEALIENAGKAGIRIVDEGNNKNE
jgi:hypothetical protein